MGPLLISVGVVAVCIAFAGWLTMGGRHAEPATPTAQVRRAPTGWVRLRSAVTLACLSALLGVAAAVGIGAVVLLLFSLLRSSIG